MALPRARLAGLDWLLLGASLVSGGIAGYLGLLLGMRLLLEPRIVSETALRLSKYTVLVEQVLQHEKAPLPAGVVVRPQSQLPSGPPAPAQRFERLVQQAMEQEFGLIRMLQRDQPPLQDVWGGHWVRLRNQDSRSGEALWLYQSERLSNSLWYLPPLRILAMVIGGLAGLVLFLRLKVERPLSQLLDLLAEQGSAAPLQLLPEQGIAPIRLLSLRINRLLERINNTAMVRPQPQQRQSAPEAQGPGAGNRGTLLRRPPGAFKTAGRTRWRPQGRAKLARGAVLVRPLARLAGLETSPGGCQALLGLDLVGAGWLALKASSSTLGRLEGGFSGGSIDAATQLGSVDQHGDLISFDFSESAHQGNR